MASTPETLRIAAGVKVAIGTQVDATTDQLVRAWAAAWNVLLPEWTSAIREAADLVYDGETTWRAWSRQERARKALHETALALQRLSGQAGITITGSLPAILEITAIGHAASIASQLPPGGVTYPRVDAKALDAIVRRTTKQITARTRPISAEATRAIRQSLVQGVATGLNPKVAARLMIERTQNGFAGGLSRAMTVARTESLDAHRVSGQAADEAASDILAGWQWHAQLGPRTCPSCLALHGSIHPVSEPGPLDHPNGRCTRIPVPKSWAELGFDIPEPEPIVQDARAWFAAQPAETQVQIMGRDRLALLNSGRITWDDIPVRKGNPDWRDAYQIRPVRDLERRAA